MRPSPWKAPDATTVSSAILFHWATRFGPLAAAGDELPATMVPARHRAAMIPTAGLPGQVRSELCMFVPSSSQPGHRAGSNAVSGISILIVGRQGSRTATPFAWGGSRRPARPPPPRTEPKLGRDGNAGTRHRAPIGALPEAQSRPDGRVGLAIGSARRNGDRVG